MLALFLCSTPFGIKEVRTITQRLRQISLWSAQRLSASKKFGPALVCEPWSGNTSAQRLSASKKFGRHVRQLTGSQVRVLNAFRHQRSSDRIGHKNDPAVSTCSTPFGIKEVRTRQTFWASMMLNVLNAFRHQRSSDVSLIGEESCPSLSCSTPFGIKEVRTSKTGAAHLVSDCAQRLSASKKFGRVSLKTSCM